MSGKSKSTERAEAMARKFRDDMARVLRKWESVAVGGNPPKGKRDG